MRTSKLQDRPEVALIVVLLMSSSQITDKLLRCHPAHTLRLRASLSAHANAELAIQISTLKENFHLRNLNELVSEIRQVLRGRIKGSAWHCKNLDAREPLRALPATTVESDFGIIAELARKLIPTLETARDLAKRLGETSPETIDEILPLVRVAERVAAAPIAPPAALADPIWEQHPGLPADLVSALREYQDAKAELDGKVVEAAWDTDLTAARNVLAAHGTGFLKSFSGEWRRANRLVQSCLANSAQQLEATLTQLDRLRQGKAARAEIAKNEAVGRSAFGGLWRGERSDPEQLAVIVEWQAGLGEAGKSVRCIVTHEPERGRYRDSSTVWRGSRQSGRQRIT